MKRKRNKVVGSLEEQIIGYRRIMIRIVTLVLLSLMGLELSIGRIITTVVPKIGVAEILIICILPIALTFLALVLALCQWFDDRFLQQDMNEAEKDEVS